MGRKPIDEETKYILMWNYLILRSFWIAKDDTQKYKDLYKKLGLPDGLGEKYTTGQERMYPLKLEHFPQFRNQEFIECLIGEKKIIDEKDIDSYLGDGKGVALWTIVTEIVNERIFTRIRMKEKDKSEKELNKLAKEKKDANSSRLVRPFQN